MWLFYQKALDGSFKHDFIKFNASTSPMSRPTFSEPTQTGRLEAFQTEPARFGRENWHRRKKGNHQKKGNHPIQHRTGRYKPESIDLALFRTEPNDSVLI